MLTRTEFIEYFKQLDPRIDGNDPNCPLWIPEGNGQITCQWFICTKPIKITSIKWSYHQWCNEALQGKVKCFSSSFDEQEEWWGFTDQKDITAWTLKWM